MSTVWITKLLLAHLLTDFILQQKSWIDDRNNKHFLSPYLYLHGFITAVVAMVFIGYDYWFFCLVILFTHTLIDGWKSYRPDTVFFFLLDQAMHLLVLLCGWYFLFYEWTDLANYAKEIGADYAFWVKTTAFLFLSFPSGIVIEKMTRKWRQDLKDPIGLAKAGKWIGILERMLILIFLLQNQYGAIGLLITAKGLLRFSEKDRQEEKTEYVLIGSLISFSFSIITGIIVQNLLR